MMPTTSDRPSPRERSAALVHRYYMAYNNGDRPGMLAVLSEDVAHDINQGPRETGREAFAAFLQHMDGRYREHLREVVILVSDDGQRAAAEYVVHGEYVATDTGLPEATGQHYALPGGAFFGIRFDDAGEPWISRVSSYYNLEQWRQQVAPGA